LTGFGLDLRVFLRSIKLQFISCVRKIRRSPWEALLLNRRVTRNTLIMVVLMSMTTILLLGLIQPSAPGPKAYSEFQADVKAGNVITISRTLDTLTVTDTGGTQYTVIDDAPAAGDWAVIESWAPPNLKTLKYTNAPQPTWAGSSPARPAAACGPGALLHLLFMRQLQGTTIRP